MPESATSRVKEEIFQAKFFYQIKNLTNGKDFCCKLNQPIIRITLVLVKLNNFLLQPQVNRIQSEPTFAPHIFSLKSRTEEHFFKSTLV